MPAAMPWRWRRGWSGGSEPERDILRIRAHSLKYALVNEPFWVQHFQVNLPGWLARMNAEVSQRFELKLMTGQESHGWFLMKFR